MKITLVNTYHQTGGAAVACHRLLLALKKTGYDASLLVQEKTYPDPDTTAFATTFVGKKIALARLALEKLYFLPYEKSPQVRYAFSQSNIGVDISKHPPIQKADIIHLHWVNQGFLSLKSIRQLVELGKPIVWTLHDMWTFTGGCHYSGTCLQYQTHCHTCPFLKNPHPTDLSFKVFEKKVALFKDADLTIVTCSGWLASLAKQSTLLKGFPIYSIPNPIDSEIYKPVNKKEARKALGLPTDKKLILFGSMKIAEERKGFSFLQEALQVLKNIFASTTHHVELLIFGKANPDIASSLPFPSHLLGSLRTDEQLINAYNSADVFVLPSLEDNLPNTIMESLSCGIPVVAFDTGGIPEMINHQENGYLAKYKSAEDLAEGIIKLLYVLDKNITSQNARQKALSSYSEKVVAEQYMQLYRKVLSSGKVK